MESWEGRIREFLPLYLPVILSGQLKRYGVDTTEVIIQTDNGSEFIGNIYKKGESAFREVLKYFKAKYVRIPPRATT